MSQAQLDYRDQFLEQVTRSLNNATFDTSVPLEDAVFRVLQAAPIKHPYDEDFGPFFTPARAAKEMGISRQAVHDRIKRGTLIVCETAEGDKVLPTFQFQDNESIKPLIQIARTLARGCADGWAISTWLSIPQPDLDGLSVRDWVTNGHDLDVVKKLARHTVSVWNQ